MTSVLMKLANPCSLLNVLHYSQLKVLHHRKLQLGMCVHNYGMQLACSYIATQLYKQSTIATVQHCLSQVFFYCMYCSSGNTFTSKQLTKCGYQIARQLAILCCVYELRCFATYSYSYINTQASNLNYATITYTS